MRAWIAVLLIVAAAAPAFALPVEEKNVVSGKAKLDPAKGYVFLTTPSRLMGMFIRVPDAEDIAAYTKDWDKKFGAAQRHYTRAAASYDHDLKLAKQTGMPLPEVPVQPLPDSFSIGAIEARTVESFGPEYVYAKDPGGASFSYLTMVKPGTYIWYGPVMLTPQNGYLGVCFCMGSVRFEVKPGVVTDLGNFISAGPQADAQQTADQSELRIGGAVSAYRIGQPVTGEVRYGLPSSLQAWPASRARFAAQGKLNNFFGVTISRLPPVPGILAYRRDVVIDVASGTEPAGYLPSPHGGPPAVSH